MPLPVLQFISSQSGYGWRHAPTYRSQELEGGLSRRRRDLLSRSREVRVNWTVDRAGHDALWQFYRVTTSNGSLPFEVDLILDDAALTRHVARFAPGTFGLRSVEGDRYNLAAELNVKPAAVDEAADNDYMDMFEGYDGDSDQIEQIADLLAKLVNEDLPEAST